MSEEKICDRCGSEYRLTRHHEAMRDKDSINCEVCGEELISWNGGGYYTSYLLERREKHKDSNT